MLSALDGLPKTGRKVLCISGKRDLLVMTEMVSVDADAYRAADNGKSVITETVIGTSWCSHIATCSPPTTPELPLPGIQARKIHSAPAR